MEENEIKEEQKKEMRLEELLLRDFLQNNKLHLRDFSGVGRFKSIRRAIRRGNASFYGTVYPKRPFSNRKRGKRTLTYIKRQIHERLRTKDN